MIGGFVDQGCVDLVERFAFPLPAMTVFSFTGFPEQDTVYLKSLCFDRLRLTWGRPSVEEQKPTADKMSYLFAYVENFVRGRADDLRDDYTNDLLRIREEDEDALSLEEVTSLSYSLTFAGHETTTNLIANGLRQLLTRLEARIAFELLTTRMPDLRLAPGDQTIEFGPNISFRGPKELWVE